MCLAWAVGNMARLRLVLSQDHGDHQHHFSHPSFGLLAAAKALLNFCIVLGVWRWAETGGSQRSLEGADEIRYIKH